jgi:YD repeat-containing protein
MKSRTRKWGRVILASLVLVAVPALLLAEARKPWNRAALPTSIRGRVHFAAAQVPAFPMGDRRLDKAENWPATMTIGGIPCVRRIHAWDDDDAVALASLKDAEPEHRLMLFYDHAGSGWNSANAGWGPRYTWNAQRKLIERLWYEPDSTRLVTHDYTYYRSGRLLGYSVRKEPRKHARISAKPYEFLSQFFDDDGKLIAIAYEKMSTDSRDSVYAWMGAVVPYDQFRMKTHILYSSAHPGDR